HRSFSDDYLKDHDRERTTGRNRAGLRVGTDAGGSVVVRPRCMRNANIPNGFSVFLDEISKGGDRVPWRLALRRALRELLLQGAPMHVEDAGRGRDVAVVRRQHALD